MRREARVGVIVIVALAALAAAIFLIGDRDQVFSRKNHYTIDFLRVGGLGPGAPVHLSGVVVGQVETIDLPPQVDSAELTVTVSIDRKYQDRVRTDSIARIKTLGLMGDKFIDISSGTPVAEAILPGGRIAAATPTDVDQLIASGEDFVDNVLTMSVSVRELLGKLEEGEGVLGQLTSDGETAESMRRTLQALERVLVRMESGQGTLGRLLRDDTAISRLENSLARLDIVTTRLAEGEGAIGLLMTDAEARERLDRTLANLDAASKTFADLAATLRDGEGLLPTLINDPEFGRQVASDLRQLTTNLKRVSDKLESGDGTVAQLINDPDAYQALTDILVGVNENKFLRWLVRGRQKKGIKERYQEDVESSPEPVIDDTTRGEEEGS